MPTIPLTKWATSLRILEDQPEDPQLPTGPELRARRTALGLQRYHVATVARLHAALVYKVEKGTLPHACYRRRLAEALDSLTKELKRP
jgi:predicted transcriptional regulator